MAYWVTVHYPHPVDDGLMWAVYLQERELPRAPRTGDQVLFYCGKYPPVIDGQPVSAVRRTLNGQTAQVPLERTEGGIVGMAVVAGPVQLVSESGHPRYDYGNSDSWAWYVPCRDFRRGSLVTRERYRELHPQRRGVAVRTGLYQIDETLFRRLVAALGVSEGASPADHGTVVRLAPQPGITPQTPARDALAAAGLAQPERILTRVGEVQGQTERDTEDVVKSLLLALGHEERSIKFQRGRIDIRVELPGGLTQMVVEVKRSLPARRDEARRQGFDYANQVDALLVVLTDADHYEIYDRTKGTSYDGMLVGRFRLTAFSAADVPALNLLRPH